MHTPSDQVTARNPSYRNIRTCAHRYKPKDAPKEFFFFWISGKKPGNFLYVNQKEDEV